MRLILLLAIAAFALPGQRRNEEEDAHKNPLADQPAALEAGRKLFVTSCSACHGATGEGGRGPNLAEGRQVRRLTDKQLFTSIEKGVPGTDMPPTKLPEEQIWQLAAFVRNLSAPALESRVPGNPEAGGAIFFGKGRCAECHMIAGRGGFLGPDLSDIGMTRPLSRLRESILKPSARIVDGFQGVTVSTKDGKKITGVARNDNNYSIQILDAPGNLHLLSKNDLRDIIFQKNSLMPGDYQKRLSSEELTDVLAFLSRQSIRPPMETKRRSWNKK